MFFREKSVILWRIFGRKVYQLSIKGLTKRELNKIEKASNKKRI